MPARRIRVADLFCGAGGTSTGLLHAAERMGRRVELTAVNHWERAIETHAANHPKAYHFCQNLADLDPKKAVPGGRLDLLVASPECFPAGTLILTSRGLVPIEKITTSHYVLTHAGNWQRVTAIMTATKPTVIVRGHGHYSLETTAEHPIYARSRKRSWPKAKRSGVWAWSEPEWTPAARMNRRFWATPTRIPSLPRLLPTLFGGIEDTPEFWWVVGRWLGDGSVSLRPGKGGEITVCCGRHEADDLAGRLAAGWPHLRWSRREVRTATLFECRSSDMANWIIRHFGKLAHGKTVPVWAMGMNAEFRTALLDGYLSADGHNNGRKQEATTVSKSLAIGIRLLAETLGHRVALHKAPQHSGTIEGRKVNTRDVHRVMWVDDRKRNYSEDIDGLAWSRVREVSPGRDAVEVFNLSVDEDESYIADGIVVHNCTHHSVARGGKPVNDQSRASAYCVHRWCAALDVKRVLIENVPEFATWGPLDAKGRPTKSGRGKLFAAFLGTFKAMGYRVEWRVLNAADFGGATTRRRLFIQCAKGRLPIRWPAPSHEPNPVPSLVAQLPRWRAAREIIDWALPGQSIFWRKRPLSENTLKRIEAGLRKFGGANAEPFLVLLRRHADGKSIDQPVPTLTAGGTHVGLCEPFLTTLNYTKSREHDGRYSRDPGEPLPTITSQGNRFGIVEPFVARMCNSGDDNCRVKSTDEPIGTIHAGGGSFGLVEPFLMGMSQTGSNGDRLRGTDAPLNTVTTADDMGLVQPFLMHTTHQGGDRVASPDDPLACVTGANRGEQAIVEPFIVPANYGEREGQAPRCHDIDRPCPTVVAGGVTHGLVEPFIVPQHSSNEPRSVDQPAPTVTTTSRGVGLCEPFLVPFYANGQADGVAGPLRTVTTKDRHALVEPDRVRLDIRFRMLQPHELAAAMGFPRDYKITGNRSEQVKQIGNAVEVNQAAALIRAMLEDAA